MGGVVGAVAADVCTEGKGGRTAGAGGNVPRNTTTSTYVTIIVIIYVNDDANQQTAETAVRTPVH